MILLQRASSLLLILAFMASLCLGIPSTSSDYNPNVPLNETFVLLKNISQQVVQPEEFIKISMGDYFRGQFLSYHFDIITDAFQNYTDDLINQQYGVIETTNIPFTQQTSQLEGQIASTIVYKDINSNLYLAFVDQNVTFNLYFLEAYYSSFDSYVPFLYGIDLYNSDEMSDKLKCSHLLGLNQSTFLINCLSNDESYGYPTGVFVYMNYIDNDDEVTMELSYVQNQFDYMTLEYGTFLSYSFINKTTEQIDNFYVMKFNDSSNYFLILAENFTVLYNLSYIVTPFYNDAYPELNHTDMDIQEILQIPGFPILVIADYSYGIFMINITCDNYTCYQNGETHYVYFPKVNALCYVTQLLAEQYIIFGLVSSPPQVVEILYGFTFSYIQDIFVIEQDDLNFVAANKISANKNYIITQFIAIDSFIPQIRLYSRSTNQFSFGHFWYIFPQLSQNDGFIQFLSSNENSFIVKTSHLCQIFNTLEQEIGIQATNYTFLEDIGIINQQIDVNLTVKNYSQSELSTIFSIIYLTENSSETIATTNYYVTGHQEVEFNFSCGNKMISFEVTDLFNGPQLSLVLESRGGPLDDEAAEDWQEMANGLFNLSLPYITELPTLGFGSFAENPIPIPLPNCSLNSFLNFTIDGQVFIFFTCIELFGQDIHFIDMYNLTQAEDSYILNYTIPYAQIVAFIANQDQYDFYVFSAQAANQQQSLVMHYFKIYNILAWENKQDLYLEYEELKLFQFEIDLSIQVKYKDSLTQGIIPSKAKELDDGSYQTKLVIFEFVATSGIQKLSIRGILTLNLTSQYEVENCQLDNYGFLWVLFSNSTIFIYEQEPNYPYLNETTGYSYDFYLKKISEIALNESDGLLWNFFLGDDKILFFLSNNTVQIMEMYDAAPFDLNNVMKMPISFNNSNQFNNASDSDSYNLFFIGNTSKKPIYSSINNYFSILYQHMVGDTVDFTFLNIYDISKTRNNVLMAQYQIPSDFQIDPTFAHLYLLQIGSAQIVAITGGESMLILGSFLQTLMVSDLDSDAWDILNYFCRHEHVVLQYRLYPLENEMQEVNLRIEGKNSGNLIQVGILNDSLTLMQQTFEENNYHAYNGTYLLNMNNDGYNMKFQISCVNQTSMELQENCTYSNVTSMYSNVAQSIDFLNSYDYLIGFIFVEPVFIMIDLSDRLTFFQIQTNSYTQQIASDILTVVPNLYVKKLDYFDREGNQGNVTYMVYQGFDQRNFGITKIYSSIFESPDNVNGTEYLTYPATNNVTIYIKKIGNQYRLTKAITDVVSINKVMNQSSLLLIMQFDVQSAFPESFLEFYEVDFDNSEYVSIKGSQFNTLTCVDLEISTFQVTAMSMFPLSTLLIIAIKNYGLLIYDSEQFKAVQYISMIQEAQYQYFTISSILTEQSSSIFLVFQAMGILQLDLIYDNATFGRNRTVEYNIYNYFGLYETGEEAISGQAIKFAGGYAYLTQVQGTDLVGAATYQNGFNIRYIYQYVKDNTKEVAFKEVFSDYQCQMIQGLPFYYGSYIFGSSDSITKSYQIVATVCHSELVYTVVNLEPSINIDLQQLSVLGFEELVMINISNSQDYRLMQLTVASQLDSLPSNAEEFGYFAVLILVIVILLFFVHSGSKTQAKVKEKIKKQQEEDPILSTLKQGEPLGSQRVSIDILKVKLENSKKILEERGYLPQQDILERETIIMISRKGSQRDEHD